jgi:hypothetical protein
MLCEANKTVSFHRAKRECPVRRLPQTSVASNCMAAVHVVATRMTPIQTAKSALCAGQKKDWSTGGGGSREKRGDGDVG